jgi:hypothetical protein
MYTISAAIMPKAISVTILQRIDYSKLPVGVLKWKVLKDDKLRM